MDNSKNRHGGGGDNNLGVNKLGKNIRKSPLHQTNFGNNNNAVSAAASARPNQPQPQVYNISKNDFRDVVQKLTGSPSLHNTPPRPPQNSAKPQSMRLQKIRPPPLTPINRTPMQQPPPMPPAPAAPPMVPYNNALPRPAQFGQPSPNPNPMHPGDMTWPNTAESPISAYMRILQNSMMDPGSRGNQMQPQLLHPYPPPQSHGNMPQPHPPQPSQVQGNGPLPHPALLPNPPVPMMPSPRFNGPHPPMNVTNPPIPNMPSPQPNGPPILPSPTSQFFLPSPNGYMGGFLSPRSAYPLLSPGIQFPPLTPSFPFSPFGQSGILGPSPQAPPSPVLFPPSPSGFFQLASPRWRDQ